MTRDRKMVGLTLAAVLVGAALSASVATSASPAATRTFVRTLAGTDFQSLDFRVAPQLVANSGGGIYLHSQKDATRPDDIYLQAGVDLPVGANVTEVVFFYRDCGTPAANSAPVAEYYFGSYNARQGSFTYHLPGATDEFQNCPTTNSFIRKGNPIVVVGAGRRYVVGAEVDVSHGGNEPDPNPWYVLVGARVKYTCPSVCR